MEGAERFLSTFSSRYNQDVERFLRENAIDFSNRGVARTHLVVSHIDGDHALLGYFTLTNKVLGIPRRYVSKTVEKRLSRFGVVDESTDSYAISMPLIAQLSKNYTNRLNTHIDGDALLSFACEKIAAIQFELGGRYAYLECEDTPRLLEFYARNGFGRIDGGELPKGQRLVQMIKFI